jgi:hypothetical protein
VLGFIAEGDGTLDSNLEICLQCLEAVGPPKPESPLRALDALYTLILNQIKSSLLSTTQQILTFYIFSLYYNAPDFPCIERLESILDVGCFLGFGEEVFYMALERLHSVISVIPSPELAHRRPISFFHRSFTDFLQDPNRSKHLAIDMDQTRCDIVTLALRWYGHFLRTSCKLKSESLYNTPSTVLIFFTACVLSADDKTLFGETNWEGDGERDRRRGLTHIKDFVRLNYGNLCVSLRESYRPGIVVQLEALDFRHFPVSLCIAEAKQLMHLLVWLTKDPVRLLLFGSDQAMLI